MIKSSLILLLSFVCLISCKNDTASSATVLASGFKYEMNTDMPGNLPQPGQVVSIDFQLVNDQGIVLDDSRKVETTKPAMLIPAELSSEQSRNPILSLVRKMSLGDSATVYVPIDSVPNAPQDYLNNDFIEYRVKVLNIEDELSYKERVQKEDAERRQKFESLATEKQVETKAIFDQYIAGSLEGKKMNTDSGLKVILSEETSGSLPEVGDMVEVQYYGYLKDGTSFDNSYRAGRPFKFTVGQGMVIKGWDLALPMIPEGSTAIVDIPYDLAYGEKGNPPVIPAKSDLIFYLLLEKIIKP